MKLIRLFILISVALVTLSMRGSTEWRDSIHLNEVVVKAKDKRMLHILAYVRDYSILYTYTDTAFLFREKWIDYMLPTTQKSSYSGWQFPRILNTKSYYQFKNQNGRDSVSDQFNQHFTWSDWVGLINPVPLPQKLLSADTIADTICSKYSRARIISRAGDNITLRINALVDTAGRKMIPGLSTLFRPAVNVFEDDGNDLWNRRNAMEFDKFKIRYEFQNVGADTLGLANLEFIACSVESQGRGRNMFRFNPYDELFYVDTNSEIYFVDKEYIPVKEAKKWEHHQFSGSELAELPLPATVPPISDDIAQLISRVEELKETDEDMVRARIKADRRLAGRPLEGYTNKEVIVKILKNMIGLKSKRKYNSN